MMGLRGVILLSGAVILAYGLYSLYAGWVISTWGQVAHRPSAIYWITVGALILLGGANLLVGLRMPRL